MSLTHWAASGGEPSHPQPRYASWTIREAAWGFEERVLWPGSDAARGAIERAGRAMQPLQRLIQTRLTWPLGDALP